jgi:hypothetical protein
MSQPPSLKTQGTGRIICSVNLMPFVRIDKGLIIATFHRFFGRANIMMSLYLSLEYRQS